MTEGDAIFSMAKRSKTFARIVKHFSLDKKAVLDVGCSEGHHLIAFGPGSLGLTIIPEHAEEAKRRGLVVEIKNVEDPAFSLDARFDAIWANNLFEHLESPHPFLMKMRDCVKPDGTLILGVPVIPFLSFLTRLKKFRGAFAVSHVNFFTRRTLIETAKAAGWRVREARLFYFSSPAPDWCMNLIAPHIYLIASPDPDFAYADKRLMSLEGYAQHR